MLTIIYNHYIGAGSDNMINVILLIIIFNEVLSLAWDNKFVVYEVVCVMVCVVVYIVVSIMVYVVVYIVICVVVYNTK